LAIGGDEFQERVQGLYAELIDAAGRPEDAALRRVETVLSADQVLHELARRLTCERVDFTRRSKGTIYRPFAARNLTRYAGLTQRAAADVLGVGTGVAVSLQLRRFEQRVAENPKLNTLARKCDKAFATLMRKHARTSAVLPVEPE
jgi:hypothetical protein